MAPCKRCKVAVGKLNAEGVHESEALCRDLRSDDPARVAAAMKRAEELARS